MNSKLKNLILSIGGHIHPLMGHPYTVKPFAQLDQSKCAMCFDGTPVETVIHTSSKRIDGVCLRHDLMMHSQPTHGTDLLVAEYQAEVLADMLQGVTKPKWMTVKRHAKLIGRADKAARKYSEAHVYDFIIPIIEQRAQEQDALADRLIAQIEAEREN